MKNILSYQPGTPFLGVEILDWAKFQVKNETSHNLQGNYILVHYSNILPDRKYVIHTSSRGTACGEIRKNPLLERIA